MPLSGQCLCGAITYQVSGEPGFVALCHCTDCRWASGAPMVAWAMFAEAALILTKGTPKTINSSGTAMRSFCAACGSGPVLPQRGNPPRNGRCADRHPGQPRGATADRTDTDR